MASRRLLASSLRIACVVLAPGSTAVAAADELDEFVRRTIDERHVPDLSLAVARSGRLVRQSVYRSGEGAPPGVGTALPVLSATKSFTAVAVMILAEGGKLSVEDRLGDHLPDLPVAWGPVTIRQCLAHTAGICSFERLPDYFQRVEPTNPSEAELIGLLARLPLDFPPGERWSYNNTGYLLLGMVIEKVSGEPYAEFLRRRIFEPAGLRSTRVLAPEADGRAAATGHTWRDGRVVEVPFTARTVFKSVGSIESTTDDLIAWVDAVAGGRLVRPPSVELMWSPARLKDGSEVKTCAHGWWLTEHLGRRAVAAVGGPALGFYTCATYFPDDRLTVVVRANSDSLGPAATAVTREAARLYLTSRE
jgi:D-alanyl-D-alanine carboxypeptidase